MRFSVSTSASVTGDLSALSVIFEVALVVVANHVCRGVRRLERRRQKLRVRHAEPLDFDAGILPAPRAAGRAMQRRRRPGTSTRRAFLDINCPVPYRAATVR